MRFSFICRLWYRGQACRWRQYFTTAFLLNQSFGYRLSLDHPFCMYIVVFLIWNFMKCLTGLIKVLLSFNCFASAFRNWSESSSLSMLRTRGVSRQRWSATWMGISPTKREIGASSLPSEMSTWLVSHLQLCLEQYLKLTTSPKQLFPSLFRGLSLPSLCISISSLSFAIHSCIVWNSSVANGCPEFPSVQFETINRASSMAVGYIAQARQYWLLYLGSIVLSCLQTFFQVFSWRYCYIMFCVLWWGD